MYSCGISAYVITKAKVSDDGVALHVPRVTCALPPPHAAKRVDGQSSSGGPDAGLRLLSCLLAEMDGMELATGGAARGAGCWARGEGGAGLAGRPLPGVLGRWSEVGGGGW